LWCEPQAICLTTKFSISHLNHQRQNPILAANSWASWRDFAGVVLGNCIEVNSPRLGCNLFNATAADIVLAELVSAELPGFRHQWTLVVSPGKTKEAQHLR